jgi:hypothetical protein
MSTINEKTSRLFKAATLSDDDLGYPNGVEFVPADEEWADEVVWRNLAEGRATLVVDEEIELLLAPRPRTVLDRLRHRVAVNIASRVDGHATPYTTACRLGRRPVREMRQLSGVA